MDDISKQQIGPLRSASNDPSEFTPTYLAEDVDALVSYIHKLRGDLDKISDQLHKTFQYKLKEKGE